jgi:hypothetical protein
VAPAKQCAELAGEFFGKGFNQPCGTEEKEDLSSFFGIKIFRRCHSPQLATYDDSLSED